MRATFFVLTAAAFGVAAVVACSSEPTPNPYKLPDGPIPTSTGEPDVGAPRDAGVDALIVDANAPDTATPPGWCAYHPPATAADPVKRGWRRVTNMGECATYFCDGGAATFLVSSDLKPGENAASIRPSRIEGCAHVSARTGVNEKCCPPGCYPTISTISWCRPNEVAYDCDIDPDGGAHALRPSTNCRLYGRPASAIAEVWCCDDSKPY